MKKKEKEIYQLIGLAKCLDLLWENSYNVKRMDKRVKRELIYYFGENWNKDMYEFVRKHTGEKSTARLNMPKTLKELLLNKDI